jgi:hypothetical protein
VLDAGIDELVLFEGRDVGAALDDEQLRVGEVGVHLLGEEGGGEAVLLAGDDEHGAADLAEKFARGVLTGGPQHAQEHRQVDVGEVLEVGADVLGADVGRVDLAGPQGDVERDLGGDAAPEGAGEGGAAVDPLDHGREHLREEVAALEGVGDPPVAAAEEHQGADLVGALVIGLEGHLTSHAVSDDHDLGVTEGVAHGAEVASVRGHVDRVLVDRMTGPPVAPVVPVGLGHQGGEEGPQVFPDESIAHDAIAEDGRRMCGGTPRARALSQIETSAIMGGGGGLCVDSGVAGAHGDGSGLGGRPR